MRCEPPVSGPSGTRRQESNYDTRAPRRTRRKRLQYPGAILQVSKDELEHTIEQGVTIRPVKKGGKGDYKETKLYVNRLNTKERERVDEKYVM